MGNSLLAPVLGAIVGLILGWLVAKLTGARRLQRERSAWQKELEFCRGASDAAAREMRRMKSSLVEAENARSELSATSAVSDQQLARRDRTIEKLVAELKDAEARLDGLNRRPRGLGDKFERQSRLLEQSRRRVGELEAAKAMLIETEANLTAELANASSELSSLQERFEQARRDLLACKAQYPPPA